LVYTICMGMFGSGVKTIGTAIMRVLLGMEVLG
jgi:hypothetical protein